MPTLDREPCPVEVPIVETGFAEFCAKGVRWKSDFSPWLTDEAIRAAKCKETHADILDRQEFMAAMCGPKPIKSHRK